jgi:uncharacterized protein (DUF2236 family)
MTALQTSPIDTPTPLNTEYPQPLRLGKDSVAYKVLIKNPVAPLLAGVPALALQVLHPSIGAGVYDHSTLKKRPINRLQRTAEYVAGTGLAEDDEALALVRRVNNRHKPVKGIDPVTGEAFSADDGELQIYVHVTEMGMILDAARFLGAKITPEEADRYWAEVAPVGAYLGAPPLEVPVTAKQAADVIARMEPKLEATPQGMDILAFLLKPTGSKLFTALRPLMPLNKLVAAALLPDSVRVLAGLPTSRRVDRLVRAAVRTVTTIGRPALTLLTFHLVGRRATNYYENVPERTTPRGFQLPLPRD